VTDRTVKGQPPPVRRYQSAIRTDQAAATRATVLDAARELFLSKGYAGTTVAMIANRAGVAADTVYATVGRKPVVLRELIETAISGSDQAIPAEQRDYVAAVRAARTASEKISIYAIALTAIHRRLGPIFLALRAAAATDQGCADLWATISERRSANMRLFAADLRATGSLRKDLSDADVADIVWSMNSAEYWVLLVSERRWTPEHFRSWLIDAWTRLLLTDEDHR